jgi:hypothetical protein
MNMNFIRTAAPVFREGDEVELISGSYQGALGVFVRLRNDVKWADIAERNGNVRSHPIEWLGPAGARSKGRKANGI